jgi:hypothetical protein
MTPLATSDRRCVVERFLVRLDYGVGVEQPVLRREDEPAFAALLDVRATAAEER